MFKRIKLKLHALIFWQTNAGDFFNQWYGLRLFYRNSFSKNKFSNRKSSRAFLTKQYHIVEKGLALPNPRTAFGKEKITLLIDRTESYIVKYGEDELTGSIKNCLFEYIEFNKRNKVDLNCTFFNRVEKFIAQNHSRSKGGTIEISKKELIRKVDIGFENFVKSRFSVRDFDTEDLHLSKIEEAINIAKYAPSVCNRQSWIAHVYTRKEHMIPLLKLQGGNNGFTESINKLIIITTDTRAFTTLESNQVFVDGGIFSMNLVLSFHSKGIGACCLNTCFPYTTEKKVKKIGNIPENERLIMMMGIGNLKKKYKVAISQKKDLGEIFKLH